MPIDVSLDRLMARRVKLKFYEAGMDLGWSANPIESFRLFQGKVLDEYDRLVDGVRARGHRRARQHHRTAAAGPARWSRSQLVQTQTETETHR